MALVVIHRNIIRPFNRALILYIRVNLLKIKITRALCLHPLLGPNKHVRMGIKRLFSCTKTHHLVLLQLQENFGPELLQINVRLIRQSAASLQQNERPRLLPFNGPT